MVHPIKAVLSRRALVGGFAALTSTLATGVLPRGVHALGPRGDIIPAGGRYAFDMIRNQDRVIGRHQIRFEPEGDRLRVAVDIEAEVGLGPIPLYRYRHRARVDWLGGRLMALSAETDDNGDQLAVEAEASGDILQVDGSAGRFEMPPETMPTTYWRCSTVTQSLLLDTQSGQRRQVTITEGPLESRFAGDRPAQARRHQIAGDLDIRIWYEPNGLLASMRFMIEGSRIDYRRREGHEPGQTIAPVTG